MTINLELDGEVKRERGLENPPDGHCHDEGHIFCFSVHMASDGGGVHTTPDGRHGVDVRISQVTSLGKDYDEETQDLLMDLAAKIGLPNETNLQAWEGVLAVIAASR
ncbi:MULTISPECIES: hypothetical protein [Microbacterium]|uniref:hypothetical protein n=1 Tax=Microbacterium TaxID=33882 RepID=UPI000D6415C2|nr:MULTISPECIES: hypothetical protein [Microbacterium]